MPVDDNATAGPSPGRFARVRPRDLALALGYAGLTWLLHALAMENDGAWGLRRFNGWWPLPLAIGCLALALRQLQILAASATLVVAGIVLLLVGSPGGFFLLFECSFTLVRWGGPRVSRGAEHGSLVATALMSIGMYFVTGSAAISLTLAVVAATVLVLPAQWAANVRHADQLAASRARTTESVAEAAAARTAAQDAERERRLAAERLGLAREVHGGLYTRLGAINRHSSPAAHARHRPASESRAMEEIHAHSAHGIAELDSMMRMLHRGAAPTPDGTLGEVPALIQAYRSAGHRVEYRNELPADGSTLDAATQAALHRSIHETLANFSTRAPDAEVSLWLEPRHGSVLFAASAPVAVGGQGAATNNTELKALRARSAQLGGSLRISTANDTFSVFMQLPVGTDQSAGHGAPGEPAPRRGPATTSSDDGSA